MADIGAEQVKETAPPVAEPVPGAARLPLPVQGFAGGPEGVAGLLANGDPATRAAVAGRLQRSAGNAATARLARQVLAREPAPPVAEGPAPLATDLAGLIRQFADDNLLANIFLSNLYEFADMPRPSAGGSQAVQGAANLGAVLAREAANRFLQSPRGDKLMSAVYDQLGGVGAGTPDSMRAVRMLVEQVVASEAARAGLGKLTDVVDPETLRSVMGGISEGIDTLERMRGLYKEIAGAAEQFRLKPDVMTLYGVLQKQGVLPKSLQLGSLGTINFGAKGATATIDAGNGATVTATGGQGGVGISTTGTQTVGDTTATAKYLISPAGEPQLEASLDARSKDLKLRLDALVGEHAVKKASGKLSYQRGIVDASASFMWSVDPNALNFVAAHFGLETKDKVARFVVDYAHRWRGQFTEDELKWAIGISLKELVFETEAAITVQGGSVAKASAGATISYHTKNWKFYAGASFVQVGNLAPTYEGKIGAEHKPSGVFGELGWGKSAPDPSSGGIPLGDNIGVRGGFRF